MVHKLHWTEPYLGVQCRLTLTRLIYYNTYTYLKFKTTEIWQCLIYFHNILKCSLIINKVYKNYLIKVYKNNIFLNLQRNLNSMGRMKLRGFIEMIQWSIDAIKWQGRNTGMMGSKIRLRITWAGHLKVLSRRMTRFELCVLTDSFSPNFTVTGIINRTNSKIVGDS
jgi:hypothetical protein